MSDGRPFDVAEIRDDGKLTPDEFLRLPLKVRVRMLLEGRVRFLDGDVEVSPREAIDRLLREKTGG